MTQLLSVVKKYASGKGNGLDKQLFYFYIFGSEVGGF